jgi:hypothetical protein
LRGSPLICERHFSGASHQGLEVAKPALASDHHEIDRSGPTGELRHGEADEESTGVEAPSQCRFDLLEQTLGDEFLLGGKLIPRDRLRGRHWSADDMDCQEQGGGAPMAAVPVVEDHLDDVIDEHVGLVGAVRDGDPDGLRERLAPFPG